MTTLAETCLAFLDELEALEPADDGLPARLKGLILRLVRDAAEHVADHSMGEVPAITQLAGEALRAIADEAEDPEARRCRYRRQSSVLSLLIFADAVARFHEGSRAEQRRTVDALRDRVAEALADLVEPAE
jgi:hypothetical protein